MPGRRDRLVLGTLALPDGAPAARVLDRFVAEGGRSLDVANVYRDGASARSVGAWLQARRTADDVVVYAKGCHPPACSPGLVPAEVDRALGLLGLERLDVFILHRDDPALPVAAWGDALLEQVAAGRIGAFGVSNWTVARLRELRAYVGDDGLAAFSNHFSLAAMVSAPWPGCLALSREELLGLADAGVEVLTWSSLATGFFAGRATEHWDSPENRARRDRAAALAAELGTTAPAIALAYVFHQPDYVLPVVGTRSEQHLADAFRAADLALTPEQARRLEAGP
jgi:aryl-alcohol dehydrogenase-like predicted oxidoreductase